jgi:hypothetical protein
MNESEAMEFAEEHRELIVEYILAMAVRQRGLLLINALTLEMQWISQAVIRRYLPTTQLRDARDKMSDVDNTQAVLAINNGEISGQSVLIIYNLEATTDG